MERINIGDRVTVRQGNGGYPVVPRLGLEPGNSGTVVAEAGAVGPRRLLKVRMDGAVMQMGGTGAVFYEDDLRPARRPGFLRSSRPDRLTEADLARQRLAMERWDKRQRSAVRRDRLASLAVWALVMAGTVVMLLATGRLGWMAGP